MMNKVIALLMFCFLITTVACKKDLIDVTSLTTNPFDPDYSGAPIFTYLSDTTIDELVNGSPVSTLTIEVQVHTEYFGRPTTYQVAYNDGTGPSTPSNNIPNGLLTIRIPNVVGGQEYCNLLRLANGGAYGGGNTICVTAD
ncbi:MAG: hypothetical protein JNL43_16375 [Flavobacteriales bacterium]|nr:hypothetical protein [Flavobacteriales bacterium]